MTFQQLLTEFFARGFDYLNDSGAGETRAKQWINQSYQEICGLDDWPFLEATASGGSPLTIADLRTILSLTDTTTNTNLGFIDRRTLNEAYPDQSQAGNALYAYITNGTTINTYPGNTDSLSVNYVKVPADLDNEQESAECPYH